MFASFTRRQKQPPETTLYTHMTIVLRNLQVHSDAEHVTGERQARRQTGRHQSCLHHCRWCYVAAHIWSRDGVLPFYSSPQS